uniref:Carboxylic ester hydrolase n=1 Tax=Lygus hesperus TaxID=30085 RepID=A0A146LW53_LYGHE
MWCRPLVFLSVVALSRGASAPVVDTPAAPVVVTPLGKISGWESDWATPSGRAYQCWTKVPYAQPPVGSLRFKPPKPLEKWEGVLEATGELPHCIQRGPDGQEDCLYLNIFRPKAVSMDRKLPVLFYVHGGAFQTGNSASPKFLADYFMSKDVVLVLIHYRLNGFGFVSLGDEVLPGNNGLKDQAMALKWVNENIEHFGGDPKIVTVFGTSAGGASAHYLLKSPLSEGFLARAWSDSGSINHVWSMMRTEDAAANTRTLANHFGCSMTGSEEIVECLQKIDAQELMREIDRMTPKTMTLDCPFNPVIEPNVEGAFMTEDLALRPSTKPWVSSTTNGEYLLHLLMIDTLPDSYMDKIKQNVTGYLYDWVTRHTTDPHAISLGLYFVEGAYLFEKGSWTKYQEDLPRAFAKMHGDNGFVYPAIYNMMIHQGPKWMYRFEYKGAWGILMNPKTHEPYPDDVAMHAGAEGFYLAHSHNVSAPDQEIADRLVKYLTNFAIFGDPTPKGSPLQWEQFTTPKDDTLTPKSGMETLKVTGKGDYMADSDFRENLYGIYWTWNTTIAWQ